MENNFFDKDRENIQDFQDTIRKLFDIENNIQNEEDADEYNDNVDNMNIQNPFDSFDDHHNIVSSDDNDEDNNRSIKHPSSSRSKIRYTIENNGRPSPFPIPIPNPNSNSNSSQNQNNIPSLQPSDAINMLRFAVPKPFKSDLQEFEIAKQDKQIVMKNINLSSATSVLEGCPVCCEMNPKNKHFEVVREIFAIEHYYRCVFKDEKLFNVLLYKHQQLIENECEALSIPYYKWTIEHLRHHFSKCVQSNSRIFMSYFNANHKIIQDMRKRGIVRTRDNISGTYTYNIKEWIQLQNMQRALILDIKRHRKDELTQTIIDAPDGIAASTMGVSGQKNQMNASNFVSTAVKRRVNMTQKQAPIGSRMIYEQYMHKT